MEGARNGLQTILMGYATDKSGMDHYYCTTTATGKERLGVYEAPHSLRGSTNISARVFLDFTYRPSVKNLLLALFVYRWNMDCAVERGWLPEEYGGWYNHEIIHDLQHPRLCGHIGTLLHTYCTEHLALG
jgi:hypothetical protein